MDAQQMIQSLLNDKDKYFFRGFQSYNNQMICTLGRQVDYIKHEYDYLKSFFKLDEIKDFLSHKNYYALIQIAQHYGIPTRFMDWSKNPLIALFFALGNHDFEEKKIYIAKINRTLAGGINNFPNYRTVLKDLDNLTLGELGKMTLGDISKISINHSVSPFSTIIDSVLYENAYSKLFEQMEEEFYLIEYIEDGLNNRKTKQEGLFSIMKDPQKEFPRDNCLVDEYIIYKTTRLELLKILDQEYEISNDTLFPNLDNISINLDDICKEIKNKYS